MIKCKKLVHYNQCALAFFMNNLTFKPIILNNLPITLKTQYYSHPQI